MRVTQALSLLFTALILMSPSIGIAETKSPSDSAGKPTIREVKTEIGENIVRYPQLEGMADEAVQTQINNRIVEQAKIAQRIVTLSTLQAAGAELTVDYEAFLSNDIFSTAVNAVGVMENGRSGQEYTAMTCWLDTGEPVTLQNLFSDPDAAVAAMETILESTYQDELSSYLENGALTPLPVNHFALDADGITFYYPPEQFSLLSGYGGAAQFDYSELAAYLRTEADSLPSRLNILPEVLSDAEIRERIIQTVEQGKLPHIRVAIGQPMADVITKYRLLRDPDSYPGGRYFQLEAAPFRQVLVLSDAIASGWDQSKVTGLLSYRENLYGIEVQKTEQRRWREILGEPDSSVAFDEAMAYDYGLPAGTADYYAYGDRQLLLYAGEEGILQAVRLT